jgi:hypothetical protein
MMCPLTHPLLVVCVALAAAKSAEIPTPLDQPRRVAPDEVWEIRNGRFYCNGQWVFLKTGKLLRAFEEPDTADRVIADIDVMVDKLNYNSFSINIYPDRFDSDADGRIDPGRRRAYENIGRILDHCWRRGVFASLSFETYNVGGGGTPAALFEKHPEIRAINALGEPARDVEYGGEIGKPTPSIFHPTYLKWGRDFISNFIGELGQDRASRLLCVETTVEPQYLGQCLTGNKDIRRAALDFNEAAHEAFDRWRAALSQDDPRRDSFTWPVTQAGRDKAIGNSVFNGFRAWGLARWINGDIKTVHAVAPGMYIAVDYNGRFDDDKGLRLGEHLGFLRALEDVNIIQIAAHTWHWGTTSWEDVVRVNREDHKGWAIGENITIGGDWPDNDQETTQILDDTLRLGTRWGWECVNAGNRHETDSYHLYNQDWSSPVADVIDGPNWERWLKKTGAPRCTPRPRPATQPSSKPS